MQTLVCKAHATVRTLFGKDAFDQTGFWQYYPRTWVYIKQLSIPLLVQNVSPNKITQVMLQPKYTPIWYQTVIFLLYTYHLTCTISLCCASVYCVKEQYIVHVVWPL